MTIGILGGGQLGYMLARSPVIRSVCISGFSILPRKRRVWTHRHPHHRPIHRPLLR